MRNPALNCKLTHSPPSPRVSAGLQINTPNSHCSVLGTCSQPRVEGRDPGRGWVSACLPLHPPALGTGGALVAPGAISEWGIKTPGAAAGRGETPLCSGKGLKNPQVQRSTALFPLPNGESKDQAPALLHPCCSYQVRPNSHFLCFQPRVAPSPPRCTVSITASLGAASAQAQVSGSKEN